VLVLSPRAAVQYATCVGAATTEQWAYAAPAPDGSIWVAARTAPSVMPPGYGAGFANDRTLLWRVTPGVAGGQEITVAGPGFEFFPLDLEPAPDGSVWVLGSTTSAQMRTVNAWQPVIGGISDFVVARYAPGRAEPLFLTYLGGRDGESQGRLAVAPDGDAVVLGISGSADYPVVRPLQGAPRGSGDAVITRIDASGRWIEYSTFLGGSDFEVTSLAAVDSVGNVYVAGYTYSADFPLTNRPPPWGISRTRVFLSSLDAGGRLRFSTILDWGADTVDETSLSAGVRCIAPRANGSVLAVVGYHGDDWMRDGAFLAVTDRLGNSVRAPAAITLEAGPNFAVPGAVAGAREMYLVTVVPPWLFEQQWLLKVLPIDADDREPWPRRPGPTERRK